MQTFAMTTLKALNDYKAVLRKNLSHNASNERIKELRLKRKQLQAASDIALYHTTINVIADIKKTLQHKTNPVWHCGLAEFLQYLEDFLCEYRLENNHVIHAKQNVSKLIVEAIQLISLPTEKFKTKQHKSLDEIANIVSKYGTSEQQKMLHGLLKRKIEQQPKENSTIFSKFSQMLSDEDESDWVTA
jgi:hypothetical protein